MKRRNLLGLVACGLVGAGALGALALGLDTANAADHLDPPGVLGFFKRVYFRHTFRSVMTADSDTAAVRERCGNLELEIED